MQHLIHLIKLANKFFAQAENDDLELVHNIIRSQVNLTVDPIYKKAEKLLPTVVCVRHGETAYNSSNDKSQEKLRGWLNVPLCDYGYIQAEKLGQYFMNVPVSRIVCSDLQRAHETAASIQRYTNADVEVCADLRPFNLGIYMGKPVKEYVPALLHHMHNIDDIPEGSTESFRMFLERFYNKTNTLMQEAKIHPEKGAILIVAHSRNTRAFRDLILESLPEIERMKLTTLLQEQDPTPTGHFVAAQFDGDWQLVDLPGQENLDK